MTPARRAGDPLTEANTQRASKVPAIVLAFWITKIAATTLGDWTADTAGAQDALTGVTTTAVP